MEKDKVFFIHINKCGGTSVKHLSSINPHIFIPKNDNLINIIHNKKWEKYKKVTIVRNPYKRILSLYGMLKRDGYNYTLDDVINIITDPDIKYRISDGGMRPGSKEYVKRHGLPMTHEHYSIYNKETDRLNVDYVFKIEELSDNITKFKEVLGINGNIPHRNKSKLSVNFNLFNNFQLKKINRYFHKDFIVFNYEKIMKKL